MNTYEKAVRSITDEFHKTILSRFKTAVTDYKLISDGDKILMCVSGGKDSVLCSLLLEEYRRHGGIDFSLGYIFTDPGADEKTLRDLRENAEMLKIPLEIKSTNIFRALKRTDKNPCFLCSRMRRAELFKYAKENGYNKIALGHHYDDVIETILMGMIYGGQMQTMLPKRKSDHFEGVELIRPMYLIREENILKWVLKNELRFISCGCGLSEKSPKNSKRAEIKALIKQLELENPQTAANIFNSAQNVNLRNLMSYRDSNGVHSFLDEFSE